MSSATAFFEDVIADYIETNGGFVSLHTALPTGGNEVVGGAYVREAITYTRTGTEPTVLTNTTIVEFPVATANWGNITHFAVWDASVAGNMLIRAPVTTPKSINIGDVARFNAGDLDIAVD